MKTFSQYLKDNSRNVFCVVLDCVIPTKSMENVFEELVRKAGKNPYKIYFTSTKHNLLEKKDTVKYARKMFPRYARNIILDENNDVKSIVNHLSELNYSSIHILNYSIETLETNDTVLVENRNLQSNEIIETIKSNNFQEFALNLTPSISDTEAREFYNLLRESIGLQKCDTFKANFTKSPISELREKYVLGKLFSPGDKVVIKETNEQAEIYVCGSNYVIVELDNGQRKRKWLSDVKKQ